MLNELDDLFADILTRDTELRMNQFSVCNGSYLRRGLSKGKSLLFCPEQIRLSHWNRIGLNTIDRFIVSCSKGFAEMLRAKDETA
jgi:hypothetical protein